MPRVAIGNRGRIVDLTPRELIDTGGEATVFRVPGEDTAIKLYLKPTPKRAEKLKAFLQLGVSLPQEVITPQELAFGSTGQVIGFTMRLLPSGQQPLGTLARRSDRDRFGVTTGDVTDIFIRLHQILTKLHPSGIVVGDLNPLNELYRLLGVRLRAAPGGGIEIALIDADSFQFGRFPCMAAMVRCLDPRLYGVDLALRPVFIPNDDWYAFLVLLFDSLLLTHPYGGAHRRLTTIPRRAEARVMVSDPSVVYPQNAYAPEVVSDELMHAFSMTFADGWRGIPDIGLLQNYRSILIGCPVCGLWYPSNRKECPGCKALNQLAQRIKTVVKGARATELLETQGPIVFFKLVGKTMYAVSVEGEQAILYIKRSLEKPVRKPLFKAVRGARYDVFDKYLVVCSDPYAENPELFILDISGATPVAVTTTTTERFGSRGVVFRGSVKYLYRVVGGMVTRGQIPFGNDLVESIVATGMADQTWFDAASGSDDEVAFGYFRVFERHEWFLIKDGAWYSVSIGTLDAGEAMVDRAVRFSSSSLLLLRRTKQGGREYCHLDVVDLASGALVASRRADLNDNSHLANIHQIAYAKGTLLAATNDGLYAENVATGAGKSFPDTAHYVNPGDRLYKFEDGVLAVAATHAVKVTITK